MITVLIVALTVFYSFQLGQSHARRAPVVIGASSWEPDKAGPLVQAGDAVRCAYTRTLPVSEQGDLDGLVMRRFAQVGLGRGRVLRRFERHLADCVPQQIRPAVCDLRFRATDQIAYLVLLLESAILEARWRQY